MEYLGLSSLSVSLLRKICKNPFIVGIIDMWVMELEIVEQSGEHFTRKFQMALLTSLENKRSSGTHCLNITEGKLQLPYFFIKGLMKMKLPAVQACPQQLSLLFK